MARLSENRPKYRDMPKGGILEVCWCDDCDDYEDINEFTEIWTVNHWGTGCFTESEKTGKIEAQGKRDYWVEYLGSKKTRTESMWEPGWYAAYVKGVLKVDHNEGEVA